MMNEVQEKQISYNLHLLGGPTKNVTVSPEAGREDSPGSYFGMEQSEKMAKLT